MTSKTSSRRKVFPTRHIASIFLFIIAWVALLLEWSLLGKAAGGYGQKLSGDILKFLGDGMLILLPFWFITPRWRWSLLIPIWAGALFCLINVWYFRFWSDLLPFDFMTMAGNVNADLARCIPGLWKQEDLLFAVIPSAATALWLFLSHKARLEPRFSNTQRTAATIATLLAFLISQASYTVTQYRYAWSNGMSTSWHEAFTTRISSPIFSRFQLLKNCGPTIATIKGAASLWQTIFCIRTLDKQEHNAVNNYLIHISRINEKGKKSIPDSIVLENSRKNLVVVVVESLNAELLGATVSGKAVMPVLDSLASAPCTLLARKVTTQVIDGGSGDGQMIINTGQLPLGSGSTAILMGASYSFDSLAERWNGGDKAVVFGDDLNAWNEEDTFLNYGFPTVGSSLDFQEDARLKGGDAALFSYAASLVTQLRQPFFLELLTVSMHVPFNDPGATTATWITDGACGHSAGYLRMANYFDAALGHFIESLRQKGLLERTVIVVTGDHNQSLAVSSGDSGCTLFIAANCGLTLDIGHPVGQVDIFPTLMRLTGLWKDGGYNGLGRVMTDPELTGAMSPDGTTHGNVSSDEAARQAEAFRVSDLMLRDRDRNVKK